MKSYGKSSAEHDFVLKRTKSSELIHFLCRDGVTYEKLRKVILEELHISMFSIDNIFSPFPRQAMEHIAFLAIGRQNDTYVTPLCWNDFFHSFLVHKCICSRGTISYI